MARKASKFKVGLFVIVGLAMGLSALVYLGASRYGEGADTYVTYFNESVQGLSRDSVVKYLGVDVGRVTEIRVAPDNNLIEVVMEVKFAGGIGTNMVAQLRSAGITGITFVELTRMQPGERDVSPPLSFASEYPIIPSKPSKLAHIFSVMEKIARELEEVDFKGMAEDMQGAFASARKLMNSEELNNSFRNLEGATAKLETMMTRLDLELEKANVPQIIGLVRDAVEEGDTMMTEGSKMMRQGQGVMKKGQEVMNRTNEAVEEVRDLVADLQIEVQAMELGQRSEQAGQAIENINHQFSELMARLMDVTDKLGTTSESLDRLFERLERNPSDIIWSDSPPPRRVD